MAQSYLSAIFISFLASPRRRRGGMPERSDEIPEREGHLLGHLRRVDRDVGKKLPNPSMSHFTPAMKQKSKPLVLRRKLQLHVIKIEALPINPVLIKDFVF